MNANALEGLAFRVLFPFVSDLLSVPHTSPSTSMPSEHTEAPLCGLLRSGGLNNEDDCGGDKSDIACAVLRARPTTKDGGKITLTANR